MQIIPEVVEDLDPDVFKILLEKQLNDAQGSDVNDQIPENVPINEENEFDYIGSSNGVSNL